MKEFWNTIQLVFTAVGGWLGWFLGGCDGLLYALLIFVTPPSAEGLRRRLVSRGTETPEKIRGRLLRAEEEAEYMPLYDAILVNDDLDTCVRELHSLIRNAHMRSSSRAPFISQMKQELKELNQGGY